MFENALAAYEVVSATIKNHFEQTGIAAFAFQMRSEVSIISPNPHRRGIAIALLDVAC
jgi:hypothetical protein